jgi:hypothetical protein
MDRTESSPDSLPNPAAGTDAAMSGNPMNDSIRGSNAEHRVPLHVPDLHSSVAPPGAEDLSAGQSLEGDMSEAEALQEAMAAANEPIKHQMGDAGVASGYSGGDEAEQGGSDKNAELDAHPTPEVVKSMVRDETLMEGADKNDEVMPSSPS